MVQVGDIWAFALEQRLFQQQVINTFAFRVTNVPVNYTEGAMMGQLFGDGPGTFNQAGGLRLRIRTMQSDEVEHRKWTAHRVSPIPTNVYEAAIDTNAAGLKPIGCETANLAMSITRRGELAGRRQKGRIAIAGIPTTGYEQGTFNQPTLLEGQAVGNQLFGTLTPAAGFVLELGYWSRGGVFPRRGIPTSYAPLFVRTVSATPRNTVRVQRSRTIGVGS